MLVPATELDLARVITACDEFRKLWVSLRSMPFDPPFQGGIIDISALDYMDYESLAYPAGGIESAALVWGNVLVKQVGFRWVRSERSDLLIQLNEHGYSGRSVVWPYARVFEAQCRSSPQDGKYHMLTERILVECLDDAWITAEVEDRLSRLLQAVSGQVGNGNYTGGEQ